MNENKVKHEDKEYEAHGLGAGMICDDCCFYVEEMSKQANCRCPLDVSCIASERKDNRNVYWQEVKDEI